MFAAVLKDREDHMVRIAILDLYDGVANEGMRCIRAILQQWSEVNAVVLHCDEFDVRQQLQLPDLSYDAYISSGGPGSPLESEGLEWDNLYMQWLQKVEDFNNSPTNPIKKKVFFICHSFQLACRYFKVGNVCRRKSTSFGVFPVHMMKEGLQEPVFQGLKDPFYSVDSRDFQVIQPDHKRLKEIGGKILAIEKERPHVPLERAVMALRFTAHFVGTQFHPEADAIGMSMYLQREDKKQSVINNHGEAKWTSMVEQLQDPDKILFTYSHV
ncbi:MAG: GMP synthase, partial [Bacteroidota bacterium]|nr:GMP synthase [Bacteroidota bacterium]